VLFRIYDEVFGHLEIALEFNKEIFIRKIIFLVMIIIFLVINLILNIIHFTKLLNIFKVFKVHPS
jgi:hypothetical protein